MTRRKQTHFACLVALSLVATWFAADPSRSGAAERPSGWSFWPFSRSAESNDVSATRRGGWPQVQAKPFFPDVVENSRPMKAQRGPSALERMASTPRKMWDSTVDWLTPAERKAARKTPGRTSPRGKRPTFFNRLFGTSEPQGPRTVKEWLSLERPEP